MSWHINEHGHDRDDRVGNSYSLTEQPGGVTAEC